MLGHIDVSGRILFILTMSDTLSFEEEATLDKATFYFIFLFLERGGMTAMRIELTKSDHLYELYR